MTRQRGTGSIFLQPGSSIWWYQIWVNGKRERGSTGCRSKREADAFVRRKLAEYSVGLSSPETQKVTLKELVEDVLLRNKNNGNKTVADDESRWKNHLEPFFGHLRATHMSSDLIDRYINKRKSDQTRSKTAPENGTINRELALLKSAFNHGTEQTPPKVRFVPHFNMLEENNVRRGFLQDEQYLRLSRECAVEGIWLAGLFETAYAYGWREDELLGLRLGQLDLLGKIIDLGETKNGDQRMIHMTEHVFQCLVRCVAGKKSDDFVFTRDDGSRIKDFRQAWWNACIRAGLGRFECRDCGSNVSEGRKCTTCESKKKAKYIGLKFHDLRRTGIRNMSREGIPEKVGMLISGHKTDSVYRRYNIVDMEVLKTATTKIEEHQRKIVEAENSHRTAIVGTEDGADDKGKPIN
ncbi:MAG: tyrosine-type recombinase/integrase [Terriglobales bacterium]